MLRPYQVIEVQLNPTHDEDKEKKKPPLLTQVDEEVFGFAGAVVARGGPLKRRFAWGHG